MTFSLNNVAYDTIIVSKLDFVSSFLSNRRSSLRIYFTKMGLILTKVLKQRYTHFCQGNAQMDQKFKVHGQKLLTDIITRLKQSSLFIVNTVRKIYMGSKFFNTYTEDYMYS